MLLLSRCRVLSPAPAMSQASASEHFQRQRGAGAAVEIASAYVGCIRSVRSIMSIISVVTGNLHASKLQVRRRHKLVGSVAALLREGYLADAWDRGR